MITTVLRWLPAAVLWLAVVLFLLAFGSSHEVWAFITGGALMLTAILETGRTAKRGYFMTGFRQRRRR